MRKRIGLVMLLTGLMPVGFVLCLWWAHSMFAVGVSVLAWTPLLAFGLADVAVIAAGAWLVARPRARSN